MTGSERLLAIITGLLLSGPLVAHDDEDFHRAHIAWEFRSGQWAMLTDDDNRLLGWLSWYRVWDGVLEALRTMPSSPFATVRALAEIGPPDHVLTMGPHLYIATVAIVPGAPGDAFLRLCQMAARLNPDAESVSWHHRSADGRSRFVQCSGDHRQNGILSEDL